MRHIMNITTSSEDLNRFRSREDLEAFFHAYGLDGLEVLQAGTDDRGIIPADKTIGVHLRYDAGWMDFWLQDEARLMIEYGDRVQWERCFGGSDRAALIRAYQQNLDFAAESEPEYLVFHVSDCSMIESMRREYYYSDEQVADAVIELLNSLEIHGQPWLLLENLWYPGLTMLRPEIWQRLQAGIRYPKLGVMLDVGHLLHTNMELRNEDQAVDYLHRVLDSYEDLSFIKGIHLHQSLSGAYAAELQQNWQPVEGDYTTRLWEVLGHIFQIDTHKPFRSPRIREILQRIQPEYVVWEQISNDRGQHGEQLAEQMAVLQRAGILP